MPACWKQTSLVRGHTVTSQRSCFKYLMGIRQAVTESWNQQMLQCKEAIHFRQTSLCASLLHAVCKRPNNSTWSLRRKFIQQKKILRKIQGREEADQRVSAPDPQDGDGSKLSILARHVPWLLLHVFQRDNCGTSLCCDNKASRKVT